eukprot:Opistho-2@87943
MHARPGAIHCHKDFFCGCNTDIIASQIMLLLISTLIYSSCSPSANREVRLGKTSATSNSPRTHISRKPVIFVKPITSTSTSMACPYGAGAPTGCPFDGTPLPEVEPKIGADGQRAPSGVYYGDYLQLNKLLSSQVMESEKASNAVHDEHLFIIIHQVYELWFKQMLHELDSVRQLFSSDCIEERLMLRIVSRLRRVIEIQKVLVAQVDILETMTPLDFMDFRTYLTPASGFQSCQFRMIENKIGLKQENRTKYQQQHYCEYFNQDDLTNLRKSESEVSLLQLVEKWLERTPGLETEGFDFWDKYVRSVTEMLSENLDASLKHCTGDAQKLDIINEHERSRAVFESIFDPAKHADLVEKGERRLSHKALQGALMIALYRDEPLFQIPFSMLTALMDIDSLLTKWRYQHVMMVQRMIGNKMGTGGSSGYQYLRSTISDRYKVFIDLFNLSTFLIPRERIPKLDTTIERRLSYFNA